MIHKDYCSRCKAMGIRLICYAKKGGTQYYYCTVCNARKQRDYYKTPLGKQRVLSALRNQDSKYPEKLKARQAVAYAIKTGRLKKSLLCDGCGACASVQGHHKDYTKPLVVTWLCISCHASVHRVL